MDGRDKAKKAAVFLDRDGVLTREKGYVCSVRGLEIFPYAADCVRQIHQKGYLAIVVTNQSGVARGYFTEAALLEMNQHLKEQTGVDAVYYCPHYEQGVVDGFAVKCGCRKPETGMIRQACRDFGINRESLKDSYMVGDRAGDIKCGQSAGLTTVLLESGYGTEQLEADVRADVICKDLTEFAAMLQLPDCRSIGNEADLWRRKR